MALNSFRFILLLFPILAGFYLLCFFCKKEKTKRNVLAGYLLAIGYLMVAETDIRFLLCLLAVTLITYFCPLLLERKQLGRTKAWVAFGIVADLVSLGVFKYFNFFYNQVEALFGGAKTNMNILLPIGISFYTFSSISYLVDVYRGKYEANKSFLEVALFIGFFPKIISGPIIRGRDFFESLNGLGKKNLYNFSCGIQIFVWGLFKKMVLADRLSVFVDNVFYAPKAFHSITVIWAMLSYPLQLYFDFAGYSDMAIGISKLFGIDLAWNFNFPFVARTVSEFWKRWHISLSSWLQEYLYFPLGGNRKGKIRTYVNLLLTMLLGGLWHGAAWCYILWGGLQGLALGFDKMRLERRKKKYGRKDAKKSGPAVAFLSMVASYLFFAFSIIIFRSENIMDGFAFIGQLFKPHDGMMHLYTWSLFSMVCLIIGTLVMRRKTGFAMKMPQKVEDRYFLFDLTSILGLTLFFVLCGLTVGLAYFGNTAFIYGAF